MMKRFAVASLLALSAITLVAQTDAPSVTPPGDATKGPKGIAWIVLTPSSAEAVPTDEDSVTLEYTGWDGTGNVFDATSKHPDVRVFPFIKLFPGLQEAVRTMKVGEKRRVWIPADLFPKKVDVVMDLELLALSRPFAAPAEVAEPPAGAEKTKSGVASKVLVAGSGTEHPKRGSWVTVHYTGWTTDGKMFDSSYVNGAPASFNLKDVIPGWTEGLQLMVVGEKRRFWIPEKRAYAGAEGMPKGMLVFDIELIKFR